MSHSFSQVLKLIRIHQYVKNLFIFMPIFFVGSIHDMNLFYPACIAFVSFSLITGAVYIFNDIQDINEDKLHPRKQHRPLAAGNISIKCGLLIMLFLLVLGSALMYLTSIQALAITYVYIAMNVLYSILLKSIAIVDVSIIAIGFVLRLVIGSIVTDVPLSMWIVVLTFFLALFIALAKRRDDMLILEQTGKSLRASLNGYNLKFLDASLVIIAAVNIVTYLLYTISSEMTFRGNADYLYFSTLFVIIGMLRYLQVTFIKHNSGSPFKVIINDRFLQVTIIMWLAFFIWVLYL